MPANTAQKYLFLNRFLVPEIRNILLNYKKLGTFISINPLVMKTTEANGMKNLERPYPYELDGMVSIENLYHSYSLMNLPNSSTIPIPSEWIANRISVPMRLNSHIEATGFTWNLQYELSKECSIGWTGGYTHMIGIMTATPQENTSKYKLKESMLFEIGNIYKTIINGMDLAKNCTEFNNFADQNIYIDFHNKNEYIAYLRELEYGIRFGYVIPSAHLTDEIHNSADIAGGLNGSSALYCAPELNLVLKEDITLGLVGKLFYVFPDTKTIRKRKWFESNRFGSFSGLIDITPGFIYQFSPSLSLEGLRKGLGLEIAYETYGQTKTYYGFQRSDIIEQVQMNIEDLSSWNQEHCLFSLFYDFSREINNPKYETMIAFSAYIPVSFAFASQSGRSLGLSLIFELNY